MTATLVVLGATGDLAGRLLLPALAELRASGALDPDVRFVGAGQQDWSTDEFRAHVRQRLAEHAPGVAGAHRDTLVAGLQYRRADVTDPTDVAAVLDLARDGSGPVLVYLALPTWLLLGAVRAVQAVGLPPGSRIAVEKPFGTDAASAAELNGALAGLDVYRVDHALAMTAVQKLRDARLPGTDEALDWSSTSIERVELLWEETLALEGRAAFYDRAGALRDIEQNHLLQLLCTVAAPPESGWEPGAGPAQQRAAVLRTVRLLTAADVRTTTRRARYTAGRLADDGADGGGRTVPDYADEDGVDPARDTETFAEVVLQLDTPRWLGTRFVLRAGKALSARRRGVLVHFRSGTGTAPLWLDVDDARDGAAIAAEPDAYRHVVADLLGGGTSFAVGADEVELAWQLLTPVLRGWSAGEVPLTTYPAGSTGP